MSTDEFIEVARSLSPYEAEAMIDARIQRGCVDDEPRFEAAKLGIHTGHPLRELRDIVLGVVQEQRGGRPGDALVLWGATGNVYSATAKFMKCAAVRFFLATHVDADVEALALSWLRASGDRHYRTEGAAIALIRRIALHMTPRVRDVPVDESAVRLAVELAGGDVKRAVIGVRVLARIAAYERHGRVAWRSKWIEGKAKAGEEAIPGAATPATKHWITKTVLPHVLRRVAGHSAGKRSAVYQVIVPVGRGVYGAGDTRTQSLIEILCSARRGESSSGR